MQQSFSSQTRTPDPRWIAFDAVQAARGRLGLRDRDIAALRGLLTFLRPEDWARMPVVFPSNKVLQERCGGMEERTLRRRLARLCEVGLVTRRQSPNRKRFALRGPGGAIFDAYGFDLTPLRDALPRLLEMAALEAAEQQELRLLRQVLSDRIYHAAAQGAEVEEPRRLLRRKASVEDLRAAIEAVEDLVPLPALPRPLAAETTDDDGQIDRHNQTSNEDSLMTETTKGPALDDCIDRLPSAVSFSHRRPADWQDMDRLAQELAPAIGLTPPDLAKSRDVLGHRGTTLAVLGLVEAHGRILRPAAYLTAILRQKAKGALQLPRMFLALTRRFPAGNPQACS